MRIIRPVPTGPNSTPLYDRDAPWFPPGRLRSLTAFAPMSNNGEFFLYSRDGQVVRFVSGDSWGYADIDPIGLSARALDPNQWIVLTDLPIGNRHRAQALVWHGGFLTAVEHTFLTYIPPPAYVPVPN